MLHSPVFPRPVWADEGRELVGVACVSYRASLTFKLYVHMCPHTTYTYKHTHRLDWSMAERHSEKDCKMSTRNLCPLQNKYSACGLPDNPYELLVLHYPKLQPPSTKQLFSNHTQTSHIHRVQTNHKKRQIGSYVPSICYSRHTVI